jgi:hypothetical protein
MRRSVQFLMIIGTSMALFLTLPLHAQYEQRHVQEEPEVLRGLHVTDLCLVTEARYTRHPALADRHAPYQEHPLALEHFPSGSLIIPNSRQGVAP